MTLYLIVVVVLCALGCWGINRDMHAALERNADNVETSFRACAIAFAINAILVIWGITVLARHFNV